MKRSTIFLFILACSLFTNIAGITTFRAQKNQLIQKEQKKILKKAGQAYKNLKYPVAMRYYETYLQTNANDSVALANLADCYWQKNDYNDAFRVYKRLFPKGNKKGATKEQQLRIAEMYARIHDYKRASHWLSGLEGYQAKATAFNDALTMNAMKKDSLNWHLDLLDINTAFQEFSPFIVDSILFFSSNRPDRRTMASYGNQGNGYDRLWQVPVSKVHAMPLKKIESVTKKEHPSESGISQNIVNNELYSNKNLFLDKLYFSSDTTKEVSMVKGFEKIRYNVGAATVDQNYHFYFSANYPNSDRRGTVRLRLMESFFTRRGSLKKKSLPFGNKKTYTVMHPAINPDGTLLVFSSDIPTGSGGYDLYYSQRKNIKKSWGDMKSFGGHLNTAGNEVFPTITPDGYLYYSSDALPGLGGLDIYRIPLQDALENKGEPEHLSYPVNSSGDDFGWTQDTTAVNGYFTSDRLNHNNDLYSFNYNAPVKMSFLENTVINRETKTPLEGATLFLLNKKDGKVYIAKTDKKGSYRLEVPDAENVTVKVLKDGYASFCLPATAIKISHSIDSAVITSSNFALDRLKINYTWKLNILHYAFNESDLNPETKSVLDSLISILKVYPISVEISSHTDSRGSFEYNDRLSKKRSQSVVNYMVEQGIDSTRLIAKGYGKRRLINRCNGSFPCSEQEHQANRRTEVRVVDYAVKQASPFEKVNPNKFKNGDVVNKKALPFDFFNECDPASSQENDSDKPEEPAEKE